MRSDTARNRLRISEIAVSSIATTIPATTRAVCTSEIRNGRVWNTPPMAVIEPVTIPRATAEPRPVSRPSSESASEKPMLMPAPSAVASPTNNAACEPDSRAAAKIGASVESVPSIRPDQPRLDVAQQERALVDVPPPDQALDHS